MPHCQLTQHQHRQRRPQQSDGLTPENTMDQRRRQENRQQADQRSPKDLDTV